MANVSCTIAVMEVDGKLSISAQIPDGAEKTLAGAITRAMLNGGMVMMNKALGVEQHVELTGTN